MNARNSIAVGLALSLAAANPLGAADFFVNETLDNLDASPGDGLCFVPFSGNCSLRAAIQEANSWPGQDTIWLGQGTFTLTRQGTGEDNAATGDLDIREAVTIRGVGWGRTVIDANFIDRAFDIDVPMTSVVSIHNLQIRYGNASVGGGGGIWNKAGELVLFGVSVYGNLATGGGGIMNQGTASLWDSEVAQNYTYATTSGGGITNVGSLTLRRSSIHRNGADLDGGGIFNLGALSVESSTLSNNSPDGIYAWSSPGAASVVLGSTIADNGDWGLRIGGGGPPPALTCSIVSGHLGADCSSTTIPPISSGGFNLSGDGSCSDVQTDLVGDPLLGPLIGGATKAPARAPRLGSPAIDGGSNAPCPSNDQWARPRTMDGDRDGTATADIGALEDVLLFADGFESGDTNAWSP